MFELCVWFRKICLMWGGSERFAGLGAGFLEENRKLRHRNGALEKTN